MTEKARACLSGTERLLPLIFLLLVRGNDRALRSARPASHQTRVKAKKCRARDPHLNAICYRSDHDIMICGRIHILEFIFPYNESSSKSVVAVVFYSHFHTRICCCRPFYTYIFIFVAFHSLFLMMSKTYGDKPLVFAFDGDGEQYMIGSEVKQLFICLFTIFPMLRWEIICASFVEPCIKSSPAWPGGTSPMTRGAS